MICGFLYRFSLIYLFLNLLLLFCNKSNSFFINLNFNYKIHNQQYTVEEILLKIRHQLVAIRTISTSTAMIEDESLVQHL